MADSTIRRAAGGALPTIFAAMLILNPGSQAPSPYRLAAGTDVFGAGTGGIDATGTSVYRTPGDITGWGISTMKPLTPPPPDPESTAEAPAPDFGAGALGPGNIRGGGAGGNGYGSGDLGSIGGDDLGGALPPLDQ